MNFILCVDIGVCRVLFNKLASRLHVVSHQHGEDLVSIGGVVDGDLFEQTCLGVHSGLPKLLGVHLAQTFVALRVDVLVLHAAGILVEESLALLIVVAVLADLVKSGIITVMQAAQQEKMTVEEFKKKAGLTA